MDKNTIINNIISDIKGSMMTAFYNGKKCYRFDVPSYLRDIGEDIINAIRAEFKGTRFSVCFHQWDRAYICWD